MSTTTTMIADVQREFEALVRDVQGPATASLRADEVELQVFRRLLALGGALLQLHFDSRAATRPDEPVLSPDGTLLRCHDRRSRRYVSIFGPLALRRHAYHAPGQPVVCPLDEALSLPPRGYSMVLREWVAYGATDSTYRETQTLLERVLGVSLSVAALETCLAEDACDVAAFDQQAPAPALDPAATILVAQADGKGVPIVRPARQPRVARPTSGRPGGRMKEATVSAVYAIAAYERTPDEIVSALLDASDAARQAGERVDPLAQPQPRPQRRPRPVGKQLRATLAGKTAGVTHLAQAVGRRAAASSAARVTVCDGAEALQDELRRLLPRHTLVLDIIHATEYLWEAATALLGQRHPGRLAWMRQQLTLLVGGQTAQVIAALEAAAASPECATQQRAALTRTIRYYRRNAPYMRYDAYLARGWPIGTGVVESACGHLVKDRLQQAGMRWTLPGAQAVLDLRAVRLSGEWDAYWPYHRQQQHQRRYGLPPRPRPRDIEDRCSPQALAA